ncbi:hypothetical protein B0H11DRAFT_2189979 [Mycena galericulata]|nr:hypothetical protein B0H11DRAFT_2189979 [Mycena galericulata]
MSDFGDVYHPSLMATAPHHLLRPHLIFGFQPEITRRPAHFNLRSIPFIPVLPRPCSAALLGPAFPQGMLPGVQLGANKKRRRNHYTVPRKGIRSVWTHRATNVHPKFLFQSSHLQLSGEESEKSVQTVKAKLLKDLEITEGQHPSRPKSKPAEAIEATLKCPKRHCDELIPTGNLSKDLKRLLKKRQELVSTQGSPHKFNQLDVEICSQISWDRETTRLSDMGHARGWPVSLDLPELVTQTLAMESQLIDICTDTCLLENNLAWSDFLESIDGKLFEFGRTKVGRASCFEYADIHARCGYLGPVGSQLIGSTICRLLSKSFSEIKERLIQTIDFLVTSKPRDFDADSRKFQDEQVLPPPSPAPMDLDSEHSRLRIEIEFHPHSGKPRQIIPLDTTSQRESTPACVRRQLVPAGPPPWAPFPTRADFEWGESVYMMPADNIKTQLNGLHSNWCRDTNITIKTVEELKIYLTRAKNYIPEFREHEFDEMFDDEGYHFRFFYGNPWDWLLDLVSDPTLADDIVWYPSRKYLVVDGNRQRLRDEFCNSDKWWDMQSTLPAVAGIPHCILPLLVWLDKGRVSSHTNMHPIILRSLSLPSAIRNGSGNGGGELGGFMVQVQDRKDPEDRSQGDKIRFAKFKRDVYHRVLRVIFVETLNQKASSETMKAVYEQARGQRFKGAAEDLLQRHGLHSTENAFWSLEGSDSYDAISYDTLHADDTGKWGKHLWPLLQDVLVTQGHKGMITANMFKVPRWPGLKHFDNVTTKDINDGQSWLDIEKAGFSFDSFSNARTCTRKSTENTAYYHALWHSTPDIRAKGPHSIYCTRVNEGFHQETREIYSRLNKRNVDQQMSSSDAIREAMARIRRTVNQYDAEISDRIAAMAKDAGVSPVAIKNITDSPDEEHWKLGAPQNLVDSRYAMKNTPWIGDSARKNFSSTLRTFIRATFPEEALQDDGEDVIQIRPFQCISLHYTSLENWTNCCDILRCNPPFQVNHEERFDCVVINMDDDPLTFGRLLFLFQCRLPNPPFQVNHEERFDCVVINMDDDPLTFGRLLFLFQCRLPSGRFVDITLVRLFRKSSWRPKTLWKNCRIYEDSRTIFILPWYLVRGAHMINCFGCKKADRTFYLDDVADLDWLLRAGN